jgi:hypothetical protein
MAPVRPRFKQAISNFFYRFCFLADTCSSLLQAHVKLAQAISNFFLTIFFPFFFKRTPARPRFKLAQAVSNFLNFGNSLPARFSLPI